MVAVVSAEVGAYTVLTCEEVAGIPCLLCCKEPGVMVPPEVFFPVVNLRGGLVQVDAMAQTM